MGCAASSQHGVAVGSAADANSAHLQFLATPVRGGGKALVLLDEDELSDIIISARNSTSGGGISVPFFLRAEDLERQRLEAPPSIEEDLFVYDDAVVSKNEAQVQHWRIEGRKPQASGRVQGREKDKNVSNKLFLFTDFNVCVDEVEVTVDDKDEDGSRAMRRLSTQQKTPLTVLIGATVTRTFSTMPNTVASLLRANGQANKKGLRRPLRDFKVDALIGHSSRVKCISVFPGEKSCVSCSSEDASVTMRSLITGEEEGIFTGHRDTIVSTAISPDGKYLATTSKDHTMAIWDAIITKLLYILQHKKVVICCCFSPDSKTVVSGCQDRVCRLWDTRLACERLSYSQHSGIIVSVAYSPDGTRVCSTSADRTLRVWSSSSGETFLTLKGHVGIVLACSFTSDGLHIISNDETYLCVWSATDGSCKLRLAVTDVSGKSLGTSRVGKLGWTFSCAAPGPFSEYILVACTNRFLYTFNIKNGSEECSVFCKAPVYCLTSGYNEKVVFGDTFGNVYIQTLL